MTELPLNNRLLIEQAIEDRVVEGEMRGYLGLSQIGEPCSRKLWYDFRFCSRKEFSARIGRLFQRGHREEPIIVADLKKAGVKVFNPQECREMGYSVVRMENGEEQVEVVSGYGHIKGHGDGLALKIPDAPKTLHYLEFKTMKEGVAKTTKRRPTFFHALREYGVEEACPGYWVQCQAMMRCLKITRTLFIAVNKNTDERHYERLRLNTSEADEFLERASDIVIQEYPLQRLPASPGKSHSWRCAFCNHKLICLEGAEPLRNCRTCAYCDIENEGKWSCSEKGDFLEPHWLSLKNQIVGCRDWRKMKGLQK
jgi:hypothetical protein